MGVPVWGPHDKDVVFGVFTGVPPTSGNYLVRQNLKQENATQTSQVGALIRLSFRFEKFPHFHQTCKGKLCG